MNIKELREPLGSKQTGLILRDDARLTIAFSQEAIQLKAEALAQSELIDQVNDAASQAEAVAAQTGVVNLIRLVEKERKRVKEPILDFCAQIEAGTKAFLKELREKELLLGQFIGDFQTLEQARVRAEQQAENERLAALEREKAKKIMKAKSHEDLDRIQAQFNERAAAEAPTEPIAPIRAEGQRVREDWDIQVTDIWTLARAHPVCVKIEPRLSEIRNLLDAGAHVSGILAKRVIKSGVRSGGAMRAIEV